MKGKCHHSFVALVMVFAYNSPELNPAEQNFRHLRQKLSNTIFPTLDALQDALIDEHQLFWERPTVLLTLTGYPWWVEASTVTYLLLLESVLQDYDSFVICLRHFSSIIGSRLIQLDFSS